jgi:hypothetical protein
MILEVKIMVLLVTRMILRVKIMVLQVTGMILKLQDWFNEN